MKMKKTKGVFLLFIIGIMFIILGGVMFLASQNRNTAEKVYQSGVIYKSKKHNKNDVVATKIIDIGEANETKDGTLVYLAITENKKNAILVEVNKNSKTHNAIEQWITSDEESLYIVGKLVEVDEATKVKISNSNQEIGHSFVIDSTYGLSNADWENDLFWVPIWSLGSIILGGLVIVSSIIRLRRNKKGYEEIMSLYPELQQTDFLQNATFIGKRSKTIVYKHHLFVLRAALEYIDLTKTKWLDIQEVYVYRSSNLVVYTIDLENNERKIEAGRFTKKVMEEWSELFNYLEQNFSHIALGESNKPIESSNNKQSNTTITEFLAKKQEKREQTITNQNEQDDSANQLEQDSKER